MISSKEDYIWYKKADELALEINQNSKLIRIYSHIFYDNWRYELKLRKAEYVSNCSRTKIGKAYGLFLVSMLRHFGNRIGYQIPINTCGPGLALFHIGTIIINEYTKIGKNFRCQSMVNIGRNEWLDTGGADVVPIIGDNVVIMPGAKLSGSIEIADNIVIGANAVVTKSFTTPGITIAGVPARKISDKNSSLILSADFADVAKQIIEQRYEKRRKR